MPRQQDASLTEVLSAQPSAVPSIRRRLEQFAIDNGANGPQTADIGLAVTEAVTNAIIHGYRGGPGQVRIVAASIAHSLSILVIDDGVGFHQPAARPGLGVGWPLIATVSDDFAVRATTNGGTEIEMRFRI